MTLSKARSITTNQVDIHENLKGIVERHQKHQFEKPIAKHTQNAFNLVLDYLANWDSDVIIDACCGVGESTAKIAHENPDARVIGIDKSVARLDKHSNYENLNNGQNYILVQADLVDFWRLMASYLNERHCFKWRIAKQFILYPNPYPKSSQIGKRWYASAVFKDILFVCSYIEWRSNWNLYLQECLEASKMFGLNGQISVIQTDNIEDISKCAYTPFERKYQLSGQTCFKLVIHPDGLER